MSSFWNLARKSAVTPVVVFDPEHVEEFRNYGIQLQMTTPGDWSVYDHCHNVWIPLDPGDWIAEGPEKEHYPIRTEVFNKTYAIEPGCDICGKGTLEIRAMWSDREIDICDSDECLKEVIYRRDNDNTGDRVSLIVDYVRTGKFEVIPYDERRTPPS